MGFVSGCRNWAEIIISRCEKVKQEVLQMQKLGLDEIKSLSKILTGKYDGSRLPYRATPIERFAVKIEVDEISGCWCWTASLNNAGYPNFNGTSAHRFIYEYLFDAIPAPMQIDHLCRNRRCANPNHLEIVTAVENFMRGCRHCVDCRQKRCLNH